MKEKQYAFNIGIDRITYNYEVIDYVRDFFDGSEACRDHLDKGDFEILFKEWHFFNRLRKINYDSFLPFFLLDCGIEWRDKIDISDNNTINKIDSDLSLVIPFYLIRYLNKYKRNID